MSDAHTRPDAGPVQEPGGPGHEHLVAGAADGETGVLLQHHIDDLGTDGRHHTRIRGRTGWQVQFWLVLFLLAVAAYVIAAVYGTGSYRMLDALKLFPSEFPGYPPGERWQYRVAAHLAAVLTVLATFSVLAVLLADRLTEIRARRRRRHAVVCGLGESGLRSVRALRAAGYRVTCLDPTASADTADDAREAGALVLQRDPTHQLALRSARVDRADYVICTYLNDAANTRIASQVVALVQAHATGSAPSIHVQIESPDLAGLLRAPLASFGEARLHFFDLSSVWARALLGNPGGPFVRLDGMPPRVLVIGGARLGRAVAVGAARRWHEHARATESDRRATIVLVAPDAEEVSAGLVQRYPAIPRVCDLVPVNQDVDPSTLLGRVEAHGVPSATYVCLDDHSANLAVALQLAYGRTQSGPVFLPASAAAAELGPLLLEAGHLYPVFLPDDAASLDLLHDQMLDTLAREVHRVYLHSRREATDFGTWPNDRPWSDLGEEGRRSTRRHVDGMIEQLRAVWFQIEPRYDWDEPPAGLTNEAVEAMAELEHARWCREQRAAGVVYGPVREPGKRHELLVAWRDLPAQSLAQQRNRDFVKARPTLLARAGFRLVRDDEARDVLARGLHERHVADRRSRGESGPHAVPWDELTEEERDHNRASVDHIAVKLARIGCRVIPSLLAPSTDVVFAGEEIEQMAELEHERWVDEYVAAGWSLGPRNDAARTHPGLVPWSELPESEREKDREVVREIPSLLASVSRRVLREAED